MNIVLSLHRLSERPASDMLHTCRRAAYIKHLSSIFRYPDTDASFILPDVIRRIINH